MTTEILGFIKHPTQQQQLVRCSGSSSNFCTSSQNIGQQQQHQQRQSWFQQSRSTNRFVHARARAHTNRGFSTDNESQTKDNCSHLLSRATARQLKGDIPGAIVLASKALLILREEQLGCNTTTSSSNNNNDVLKQVDEQQEQLLADTLIFLGKLLQLQENFEDASRSFDEARWIFNEERRRHEQEQEQQQQQQQEEQTKRARAAVLVGIKKKEYSALSHLAFAQAQRGFSVSSRHSDNDQSLQQLLQLAEANYKEALHGLEESVGWEDGMTNHTAHELSMLYKKMGRYQQAIATLTNTKNQLAEVFGDGDPKVLQLNGELAECWQKASSSSEFASTASASQACPEETAVALLEEALDSLPPNSPEARRIFVRLEELKEEILLMETATATATGENTQQQGAAAAGRTSTSSNRMQTGKGGVAVTLTKGRVRSGSVPTQNK